MKRIVFCADGTWDGSSSNTNVFKIFNALLVTATQVRFYDSGVGVNGNKIEQVLGGAFGEGLVQKIKDGYTSIAHVYEPGDEIFIFGFSRGAFTARSLAGMISTCGMPTANFDDAMVDAVFNAYRNPSQRAAMLKALPKYKIVDTPIKMIGVWDTVGSLGIPALFGGVDAVRYGFLDTTLHNTVANAYHALAIDERRAEFPPTLWTGAPAPGQTIEQVWFVGAHSDVGGGYTPGTNDSGTTLSDVTLGWMMGKGAALGLQFAPQVYNSLVPIPHKLALDEVHKSWSPTWGFPKNRTIPANSYLSDTVSARYHNDATYRPPNLSYAAGAWNPVCQEWVVVGPLPDAGLETVK